MDVSSSCQPWNERCVLHWVPRPYATPAQYFVTPPRTQDDAEREKAPRKQSPSTSFYEPTLSNTTSNECTNRKSKWHSHAYVSQIQNRRMEHHQDVVLQQRIWPWSIKHARRTCFEWVRWSQREYKEEQHDNVHGCQCPTHHRIVQSGAVLHHDAHREAREHEKPQQDGTF